MSIPYESFPEEEFELQESFEPKLTYPHECPYAKRMAWYADQLMRFPTSDNMTGAQERAIWDIHSDGECPPTHVNNSPTAEWADFIEISKL